MNYYILTADVCFDWSGGEYSYGSVSDILLGHGYYTLESAEAEAQRLLEEYCNEHYDARLDESSFNTVLADV